MNLLVSAAGLVNVSVKRVTGVWLSDVFLMTVELCGTEEEICSSAGQDLATAVITKFL